MINRQPTIVETRNSWKSYTNSRNQMLIYHPLLSGGEMFGLQLEPFILQSFLFRSVLQLIIMNWHFFELCGTQLFKLWDISNFKCLVPGEAGCDSD